MKPRGAAITSEAQRELIGQTLKTISQKSDKYYILYLLLIHMDIKCETALSLHVKDVLPSHKLCLPNGTLPIPDQIAEELFSFIQGRNPEEPLFVNNTSAKKPLSTAAVKTTLIKVSKKLGVVVNLTIFRKTFIYGRYLDGDKKFLDTLHLCREDKILSYLGLQDESKKNPLSGNSSRRLLLENNYGYKQLQDYQQSLGEILEQIQDPYVSDDVCERTMHLLMKLHKAFDEFHTGYNVQD